LTEGGVLRPTRVISKKRQAVLKTQAKVECVGDENQNPYRNLFPAFQRGGKGKGTTKPEIEYTVETNKSKGGAFRQAYIWKPFGMGGAGGGKGEVNSLGQGGGRGV